MKTKVKPARHTGPVRELMEPIRKLKCRVSPGMFSDEALVVVKDVRGITHSFFVPKEAVSNDTVLVTAIKDETGYLVIIPTPENSSVFVHSEDVI